MDKSPGFRAAKKAAKKALALVRRQKSANPLGGSRRRRFQPAKFTRNLECGNGERGAGSKAHEVSLVRVYIIWGLYYFEFVLFGFCAIWLLCPSGLYYYEFGF
jgi:hypothetical protein